MKENKGITLITLVITIIILLILSVVALRTFTDEESIVDKAKSTVDKYNESVEEEKAILESIAQKLKKSSAGKSDTFDKEPEMAGSGTEANPYIIESIEDLVQFSLDVENGNDFAGKVVKLAQDLDFNNDKSYIDPTRTDMAREDEIALKTEMTSGIGFFPIGFDEEAFSGTFDGQGHTIYNLYQSQETDHLGLFGHVVNGSVNNVNVTGTIKGEVSTKPNEGSYYIGGVVGQISSDTDVQIENCSFNGTIQASYYVGGVVGEIITTANATIKNCTSTGTLKGLGQVGGIVGGTDGVQLTIENCNNKSNISLTENYRAAGIIAYANVSSVSVKNSINSGTISSSAADAHALAGILASVNINTTNPTIISITDCNNTGAVTGEYEVAGILGQVYCAANVEMILRGNENNGIITSINSPNSNAIGGIVGHVGTKETATILLTIDDCTNNAKITANKIEGIAGIIGNVWGETTIEANIKNCKNNGIIEMTSTEETSGISGILAKMSANSDIILTMNNCVNNANITCNNTTEAAGILADVWAGGTLNTTVKNCLNNGNLLTTLTTDSANHAGIIGGLSTSRTMTAKIENCINVGNVGNGTLESVGGILGSSWPNTVAGSSLTINNCVNVGTITGSTDWGAGGIVGGIETDMNINVTNTFYLADSYNVGEMLGTSKTETEMKATGTGSVLATLNTEAQAHSSDAIPYLTWKQNASSYPVINL